MSKKMLMIISAVVIVLGGLFVVSMLIARVLLGDADVKIAGNRGVGLVEVRGMILDSRETVRQLRYFLKQDEIRAVVLRVDSPGGVVAPSQEICEEVRKFAARKKIIVSMGSLAASGGYYVSAPATLIYANPGTLTASIGVILKLSNIETLMDRIGIKSHTLKTGKYKDSGSPLRKLSEDDRAMLQSVIDSTHEQFVRAVASGRKLPVQQVRRIADGRILSGEQALALKLVDRLGTLQDAIEEAGRLSGIEGEPEVVLPPRKKVNYWDLLADGTEGALEKALGRASGGMLLMYGRE
ncbi:signal peptide peptidase SppA [Pelobacter propionicus]|uniref:Signal peptide peptidase A, Serine peptidase, MEROPS family S49 n=1 Tax=Pelobacter propionicus (strain DSM 2379 / NBRC 103807 / OttBd1) TaxID=338966 RepID=A1AS35_PELPD|nr:signal peptide peptidase SppA [Pelobacter propionicus]ABL00156.1 signal peptide peptidase A, Serine peptidase, MEROPS family S49 [Pelobacter propionicus DSM 2379]